MNRVLFPYTWLRCGESSVLCFPPLTLHANIFAVLLFDTPCPHTSTMRLLIVQANAIHRHRLELIRERNAEEVGWLCDGTCFGCAFPAPVRDGV